MNCKVCSNTSANTPGIPFFRFPKEGKKCQKWAELCHLKCSYMKNGPLQFNKSFRICSDHFDADEMMHDGRKVRLFPSAEPKFLLNKFRKVNRKNKAVLKKLNAAKVTLSNHYCRLCAKEKKDIISIYGWRGKTMYGLEKKLKYFPFAIEKYDILPLGVCQDCIVKVDKFAEFVETCIEAQTKLKDLLNAKIDDVTVQLVDPIEEILANSVLVPIEETQETQKTSAGIDENTSLSETLSIGGGEEEIQSVNEVQSSGTDKAQIQGVDTPQNTHSDEAQNFDGTQNTCVTEPPSQTIFITQSTGLNEALTANEDEAQEINKDLFQLLNGNETQTYDVDETQETNCAVISQPPLDIPEHNLYYYVHLNEIILPELYESIINDPIEEKIQTEQNCPEPVPDLIKLSDEDLITLYGATDNDLTLHNDPNLYCAYWDVPTYDQFAPTQMMDQTAIINTDFDSIEKFTCDICLKDFSTPEMLSSHINACCVQSNNLEKCTALDFLPNFNEEISKKAKEFVWAIDVSNTEPHDSLEVELEGAELPLQEKKSSSKGKKKIRKKLKPQCEFCEKLFTTFDECQEHEKSHQGTQPYMCLKCKKTYRSKKGLHRHFPVHSGETFPCPKCETIFRRRDSLLNHKRVHRMFTCKICSFVSKQKAEFLKHEKDHELPIELPELYDAEQAEKEFCEYDLPDLTSERDLLDPQTLNEFLADTEPIQSTYIVISNEFTPMEDDLEQIVANQLIAMEM